jgi:hypothetical protein
VVLARRLTTPTGGLIGLAVLATIGFFAILTVLGQSCGDCVTLSTGAALPDRLADAAPHIGSSTPSASAGASSSSQHASADAGTPNNAASTDAPPASTSKPVSQPAPVTPDIAGAANYVRAFYADLATGRFRAAWPRLAADLRARHGSFDTWRKGFATTVRQSTSDITATSSGSSAALVRLTLTAVDRGPCGREVQSRFAVTWRLALSHGQWHAQHAAARPLGKAPVAQMAGC